MPVGKTIKKTKQINDAAAAGVKLLKGYQDGVNALAKDGKTLSDLQKTIKALTFVGKLDTGLAMISLGLTVAQMFFSVKTPQDVILEEIGKLSDKLDSIKADIHLLEEKFKLESTLKTVFHAVSHVERINNHLIEHGENPSETTLGRLLKKSNGHDLDQALTDLRLAVVGTEASERVLEQIYNISHGQVEEVTRMAFFIKINAERCVQTWAACETAIAKAKKEKEGGVWSDEDSANKALEFAGDVKSDHSIAGQIRVLSKACNTWAKKGLSYGERRNNLKAKLDAMFTEQKPKHEAYQDEAERLVGELSTTYPWQLFTVICQPGEWGYDRYTYLIGGDGPGTLIVRDQIDDLRGQMTMLIIAVKNNVGKTGKPSLITDVRRLDAKLDLKHPERTEWTAGDLRKFVVGHYAEYIVNQMDLGDRVSLDGINLRANLEAWPGFRVMDGDKHKVISILAAERELNHEFPEFHDWKGDFIWLSDFGIDVLKDKQDGIGFVSQNYAALGVEEFDDPGLFGTDKTYVSCIHLCPGEFEERAEKRDT